MCIYIYIYLKEHAREEDGSAVCSQLVWGTFNWNEGTNIEPCSFSEFSARVQTEPVSFSLSISSPHYKAAVAAIYNSSVLFFNSKVVII